VQLLVCQLTQIGCITEKSMAKVSELLRWLLDSPLLATAGTFGSSH